MGRPGELERSVLDVLWDGPEGTVRDVAGRLGRARAYTTILTVLDRLHAKGLVRRRKEGNAWVYSPDRTREAVLGEKVAELLSEPDTASRPLLMAFLDTAERQDPALLDELETMIRERRDRRGTPGGGEGR